MPLASLVPQAVLAPLDAADDPEAGSLKNAQANATKNSFRMLLARGSACDP